MMASHLSVYDVLERLDDDDDGLYSEDESDCEAEGISGYMSEADKEEEGADDASSSALTTGLFATQYLLLDTIATLGYGSTSILLCIPVLYCPGRRTIPQ